MPNPAAIFVKALLVIVLAVVAYQYAQRVRTVEVTTISGGVQKRVAVQPDDPAYRDELDAAQTKSIPFYAASVLLGMIGVAMLAKSLRVARKQRDARKPGYQRQF